MVFGKFTTEKFVSFKKIINKSGLEYSKIKEMKQSMVDWLHDLPGEFLTLLLYSRKLGFAEEPNYKYLCFLMNNLLLIQ